MSRNRRLGLICALALGAAAAQAAAPSVMSVQVRKAELRDTPAFLGKVVASLAYGDKVTLHQQNGAWMQVTAAGASGWIHSSAVTSKNIVLKGGDATQKTASSGEIALAGKGFNSEVEAKFRAEHGNIDFGPVDRMEQIRIPAGTLERFARAGGLQTTAGGAP